MRSCRAERGQCGVGDPFTGASIPVMVRTVLRVLTPSRTATA